MKPFRVIATIPIFLVAVLLLVGCGHKEESDGHSHDKENAEGKGKEHGHEESSPSGASFKPGKGVSLTDETRKILGVEVVDVEEEKLPRQIQFTAQVYGKGRESHVPIAGETAKNVRASGFVNPSQAAMVQPGTSVRLVSKSGTSAEGVVVEEHKALALGDAEIDLAFPESTTFKDGEFLSATITLPREELVTVIPKSALLRTSEGAFVYAVNGNSFMRTAVKVGSEAKGKVEIIDGLLAGDQVVTKPVETLWLIELRATKGGGHSH